MRNLARWSVRHRRLVVAIWLTALIGLTVISQSVGSSYKDSFSLNGTQSFDALNLLQKVAPALVTRRERGKKILADAPRPPLPDEVRNRRKTGFTLPLKEWLQQESDGRIEFGKRTWARKVYATMFSSDNGYF